MQNLRGAALTVLQAHQDFVLLGSLQERFGCIKSAKAGVNGEVIFLLHLCVCVCVLKYVYLTTMAAVTPVVYNIQILLPRTFFNCWTFGLLYWQL
jgi:hypothetical protein